jgi:UDP-hydrolysing UDP-N-acetyl-D-glucosamine 2-epimerase
MPRKICVVITARPSYARIRTALAAIREHPELELQLVVAASALLERYGDAANVIQAQGFTIDRKIYMIVEGENLVTSAKSTGLGLSELATAFDDLGPDVVVTIADRYETMATAVAASYMNIPLAHIQGGEVSGSIDEKVRHAVTKLADLHLVSSKPAADRVIRMGERAESVHITGCPSIDIAATAASAAAIPQEDLYRRYGGVGAHVDLSQGYIVVLQHPVTTEYEASRSHIEETLWSVADLGIPTLWFWPNVDAGSDGTSKGIRVFRERHKLPHVHFFRNLPPDDFLVLLRDSFCIVGNSSVAIRECSFLGVPAVNIGSRQQGRDRGANVIDVDYDRAAIAQAIRRQVAARRYHSDPLYGTGDAGQRIAHALAAASISIEKRLTY